MVQPLVRPRQIKKRTKPFVRHQSDIKKRVKVRQWEEQGDASIAL